eukprot:scaffold637_cov322-Prasinococcus_capsulatus_cf.AAC.1
MMRLPAHHDDDDDDDQHPPPIPAHPIPSQPEDPVDGGPPTFARTCRGGGREGWVGMGWMGGCAPAVGVDKWGRKAVAARRGAARCDEATTCGAGVGAGAGAGAKRHPA